MAAARLRFACPQRRPGTTRAPLPLSATAVAIREHLSARRQQLDELDPGSLDLAAAMLAAFYESVHGHITELRADHGREYRQRQLLGRDGLPVEDIAYLAIHAPDAVVEALQVLGRALGFRLEAEEPDAGRSVATEAAQVLERTGRLASTIVQALEDGRISPEEALGVDRLLHELGPDLAALEFAVHEVALGHHAGGAR